MRRLGVEVSSGAVWAGGALCSGAFCSAPGDCSVETTLRSIPGYVSLFAAAFPDEEEPVTYDNMAKAIGAFELLRMTDNVRDLVVKRADANTIRASAAAERELNLLRDAGASAG